MAQKVPFSQTSAHGSGACRYDYGSMESRVYFGTSLEPGWKNMRRGCNSWKRKGGQKRAVIEHQQELQMQQRTIDAERAARTPVNPAQDARKLC